MMTMRIAIGIGIKKASSFRVLLNQVLLNRVLLNQHLPQTTDFLFSNALVLEEIQDQLLLRIFEKATHQVPNFRTRGFLLPDQRRIDVSPSILQMFQIAFSLENTNRGQDRVIGQGGSLHNR